MGYVARTIAQIQAQIKQAIGANSTLSALTSTSQTAYWNLWTFIQATSTNLMEQIMSIFFNEIETIVAEAIPGTAPWIQNQVLQFQYSATNPEVAVINPDFTVGYPTVDTTLQVVTQCAVVVSGASVITVKVATGGLTPAPLDGSAGISGPQCLSLQGYLQTILPAGANFQLINAEADTLLVNATVFYNGQYNSAIQNNVIAALKAYMAALPFNGIVKVSDIEKTILGVAGVVDVTFSQITCASSFVSVNLVLNSQLLTRDYQTVSGYIVNASSPKDFATLLSFQVATT